MDKNEFEKRFLSLVYQTDVTITAPNVAYHLKLPIDEVQEHLLELELNSVIRQETDDEGGTHYVMPNRPAPGTLPAGRQLSTEEDGDLPPPHDYNPAELAAAPIYSRPPAKGKNVNGLVLNVILPGLGSLVCGQKSGALMLGLLILGILMFFIMPWWGSKLLGILPIVAAWIWSIVAGVGLLSET